MQRSGGCASGQLAGSWPPCWRCAPRPRSPLARRARATRVGPAPASQQLQLVFPLTADLAGLERFANAVTTPGSPGYGHYRSIPELARRFGATAATRDSVARYLRRRGRQPTQARRDRAVRRRHGQRASWPRSCSPPRWRTTAPRARRGSSRPPPPPAVPAGLRGLVTGVVGLDTRQLALAGRGPGGRQHARARARIAASQPSSAFPLSGTPAGCAAGVASGGFVPNQYQTAYGFSPLYAANIRGQGERVALIEIDGFRDADINAFAQCFGLDVPRLNGFGVGIKHQLAPGGESTLDLEVLDAAAPDLKAIDVYETKPSAADTLKALTAPLQNHGFHPQVISASLGSVRGRRQPRRRLQGHQVGRGRAADGRLERDHVPVLQRRPGLGGLRRARQPADRSPRRQLPGLVAVGHRRRRHQPGARLRQPDHVVRWCGTTPRCSRALPEAAAPACCSIGPPTRKARSTTTLAACQTSRCSPTSSRATRCIARATGDCVTNANPNPWQTVGGTSAATPLLAGGLALVDQQLRLNGRPSCWSTSASPPASSGVAALVPPTVCQGFGVALVTQSPVAEQYTA